MIVVISRETKKTALKCLLYLVHVNHQICSLH